jgi:hypothetical protein
MRVQTRTPAMRLRTQSSKKYVESRVEQVFCAKLEHCGGIAGLTLRQIGEAYQILSDDQLRAAYDKYGKEGAMPSSGFGMRCMAEYVCMVLTRQQRIHLSSSR